MYLNPKIFNSAIIHKINNIKEYQYCKNCNIYYSCISVYIWTKNITVWNNGRQNLEKKVFSACDKCLPIMLKKRYEFIDKNKKTDMKYYAKRLFLGSSNTYEKIIDWEMSDKKFNIK